MNLRVGIEVVPSQANVRDQRGAPDTVPTERRVVAGHVQGIPTGENRTEAGGWQGWGATAQLLLSAPASEQVVLVREVVVPPDVPLAEVLVARCLVRVVPRQAIVQRIRVCVLELPGDRVEPRLRDGLVGEWRPRIGDVPCSCERIVDRVRDLVEVAPPHCRGRNGSHESRCLADVRQLQVAEEEGPVPLDRAADGEAVLLATELCLLPRREVRFGIHGLVAHEVEARAMDLVRAGLDRQRHDPRGRLAVFSRETIRDHLELRHGVNRRLHRLLLSALRGDGLVVVVHTVDHEVDFRTALAADGNALSTRHDRAGRNHRQLQVVASVEGKVYDLAVLDHRAGRTLGRLQQRCRGLDFDDLRDRANLERDIQLAHVTDR